MEPRKELEMEPRKKEASSIQAADDKREGRTVKTDNSCLE